MIDQMTIIDGHVHTFATDQVSKKVLTAFNQLYDIRFENAGTGSIDDVVANMHSTGIDYTVMVNFASEKILKATNEFTLQAAKEHPQLIPFVSFHPVFEDENRTMLETYIQEGAKGIKFHTMAKRFNPVDKRLDSLYDYCNEIQFPIVFHCGRVSNRSLNDFADLQAIEPILRKYPQIPIILTHMVDGNREDVIRCAKAYPNVYFDTSIMITGSKTLLEHNEPSWLVDEEVVEVIQTVTAERVLFGSDYPWGCPNSDIGRILQLDLTPREKALILGDNMAKLLKLRLQY